MQKSLHFNICVIGTGGTGGNLITKLARFLNDFAKDGVSCELSIVDGDSVEMKNIGRQPFTEDDLGMNKAVALSENISYALNYPIRAYGKYIETVQDISDILYRERDSYYTETVDVLIGCVDNHKARQIMEEWFSKRRYGYTFYIDSANEFSVGEVVFSINRHGTVVSPVRSFYFPDVLEPAKSVTEMSCEELNQVAPQHLVTNSFASDIVLAYIVQLCSTDNAINMIPGGINYFDSFKMFSRFDVRNIKEAGVDETTN